MVKVRIKGTVITDRYGAMGTGDILATDEAYAKHLVVDCMAAEYVVDEKPAEKVEEDRQRTKKAK